MREKGNPPPTWWGAVQTAGEPDDSGPRAGVFQPLFQAQGGDGENLLAPGGPVGGVVGDEGRGGDGVELCEDLWAADPPSRRLAEAGATVILNLSASNEVVGKAGAVQEGVLQKQVAAGVAGEAKLRQGQDFHALLLRLPHHGVLGVVPKTYLPNYGEFYEMRWFQSGADCGDDLQCSALYRQSATRTLGVPAATQIKPSFISKPPRLRSLPLLYPQKRKKATGRGTALCCFLRIGGS